MDPRNIERSSSRGHRYRRTGQGCRRTCETYNRVPTVVVRPQRPSHVVILDNHEGSRRQQLRLSSSSSTRQLPTAAVPVDSSRDTAGALGTGNRDLRPPSGRPGVGGGGGDCWLWSHSAARTPSDADAVRGRYGAEAASLVFERGRATRRPDESVRWVGSGREPERMQSMCAVRRAG
jgi:hypothetical protein